jgi:predicted ArsR family transcriptional regulator
MSRMPELLGATRTRLLELLRRSRRSINELAAAVGISDNAVRTHLSALQRDGLVEPAGTERSTGGKPAQLYEITPDAEELFPKAYGWTLGGLLSLLEERDGREEVRALLREVGRRAAEGHGTSGTKEARVNAAASVLRELGGDVEVQPNDAGWRIQGYGCPFSAVAARHDEVCTLAESLIERMTGLAVTECCNRSDARPRCAFQVAAG